MIIDLSIHKLKCKKKHTIITKYLAYKCRVIKLGQRYDKIDKKSINLKDTVCLIDVKMLTFFSD